MVIKNNKKVNIGTKFRLPGGWQSNFWITLPSSTVFSFSKSESFEAGADWLWDEWHLIQWIESFWRSEWKVCLLICWERTPRIWELRFEAIRLCSFGIGSSPFSWRHKMASESVNFTCGFWPWTLQRNLLTKVHSYAINNYKNILCDVEMASNGRSRTLFPSTGDVLGHFD